MFKFVFLLSFNETFFQKEMFWICVRVDDCHIEEPLVYVSDGPERCSGKIWIIAEQKRENSISEEN